jgi:hypothetical protein
MCFYVFLPDIDVYIIDIFSHLIDITICVLYIIMCYQHGKLKDIASLMFDKKLAKY